MNQKLENNDSPLGKGNKYTSFSLEPLFHPQLIIHEITLEVEIILTKIDDYSFGCSSWQILNLYKKLGKQFLQKRGDPVRVFSLVCASSLSLCSNHFKGKILVFIFSPYTLSTFEILGNKITLYFQNICPRKAINNGY